jgi:hypothetical protein
MTGDYCQKCGNYVTTLLTHDCSTHEPCPSCAALHSRVAVLEKRVEEECRDHDITVISWGRRGDKIKMLNKEIKDLRAALDAAIRGRK